MIFIQTKINSNNFVNDRNSLVIVWIAQLENVKDLKKTNPIILVSLSPKILMIKRNSMTCEGNVKWHCYEEMVLLCEQLVLLLQPIICWCSVNHSLYQVNLFY